MNPPVAGAPTPDPSSSAVPRAAWTLLVFLTLLNVLNFVDRLLVGALAPLLIAELGLSRAQIGLLHGFGFIVFYTFVGLFLGVAADRWRRIPLVAAGLALWSGMTALSGWARSFVGLAIPRVFVGVGEATLTPAALSMLGDAFPPGRLAFATGVYYAGIPLGTAVSMISSSYLAPRYGWRACFFILGGIGLVAAAFLFLFREPARRAATAGSLPPVSRLAREVLAALAGRRELVLTILGGALLCYGAASALHIVTWLVEERGYLYADAAFTAGVIGIFAGFLGNLAGGWLGDAWARRSARGRAHGRLASLIAIALVFAAASLAFYLAPARTPLFFLVWFLAAACSAAWFGPLFAAIQELSPAAARATTVAFAILAVNLLGVGPGPLVTGAIGDASGLTAGLASSVGAMLLSLVPLGLAARAASAASASSSSP